MHIRLADMLCNNRDSELPDIDLLVVSSRHKSPSILNKCYRIDRPQMLFVLLHWLFDIDVILQDFLVAATCQKDVLPVISRVEFNAEWCLFVLVISDDFTCFCVP